MFEEIRQELRFRRRQENTRQTRQARLQGFPEGLQDALSYQGQSVPPANEVWGKVIFSEAYVSQPVHVGGGHE